MARTRKGDSRNSPDGQPYVQGPGPAPDRGRWPVDPGASARPEGARPGSRPRRGVGIGMMLPLILAAVAAEPAVPASDPMIALVAGADGDQCLPDRSLCLDIPAVEDGEAAARSEERRVGKEWGSTGRSRGGP